MTQDGLTLHHTISEIREHIQGCKVDKVHQPQPGSLVLALRAPGKSPKLFISTGAFDSRLHLTARKYENPKSPPMFCMFLRKHLTGATLSAIEQDGLERIVTLTFSAKDELGLVRRITMIAELMGKYSNVILVHNGLIMESLRHVTRSLSRVRCVMPGLAYEPPKSSKLNPLHISRATLVEMLKKRGSTKIKPYLSSFLQGLSGQSADEILYRYMPQGYAEQPREAERLAAVIIDFFSAPPQPAMYLREGAPFFYAPRRFESIIAGAIEFESFSAMADDYHARRDALAALSGKREKLHRLVAKHLGKLIQTLQKQQLSAQQAGKAEDYKTRGDLITANIYRITRGLGTLVATDYETGEDIAIPLDTRLSPSANAQHNYKRYAKLKAGLDITLRRIADTQSDITFLQSVQLGIDACETMDELSEIEYELSKAGYMPRAQAAPRITQAPSTPHRFVSSDGYLIYAGKNNRQNDLLTMKTAAPEDIWLHTKDIPGSHVLIAGVQGDIPGQTLFEAATIAATLSKAGSGAKVQVDYAPRKNLRKPGGAKPGMVVYEGHSSLLVSPDKALLDRLREKAQ